MSRNKNALDFVGLDWSSMYRWDYYTNDAARSDVITDLSNTGSNTVKIDVNYFLNETTNEIYSIDGLTETNEKLISVGNYFKGKGFNVVLQLYITNADESGASPNPGKNIYSVDISDTVKFFSSYSDLLKDLSKVAGGMQADVFSIGGEFGSITSSNRSLWENAINTVKSKYNGSITYGAAFNPNKSAEETTFKSVRDSDVYDFSVELLSLSFGDLLDYLGVHHYAARPNDPDTGGLYDGVISYDLALRSWDDVELQGFSNIKVLREAAEFYGKKILFIESAYLPMSTAKQMGANYDPKTDGGDYVSYSNLYDAEFFQVYTTLKDVFAGIIHGASLPRQIYTDRTYLAEGKKTLSIFEGTPTESVVKGWAMGSRLENDLTINLSKNSPMAFGYDGQDTFNVTTISGDISGGGNIDTVVVPHLKEKVEVKSNANIFTSIITDSKLKLDVIDLDLPDLKLSLDSVERIEFKDKKVAYDLDGNAGKSVKLLGMLLGKDSAINKDYLRDVIKLFDDGNAYEQLMNLALDVVLGQGAGGSKVVDLLYKNIVGTDTPQAYLDEYGALIDTGSISAAQLAISVGDHSLTSVQLDLVGLAQTGVEYAFAI